MSSNHSIHLNLHQILNISSEDKNTKMASKPKVPRKKNGYMMPKKLPVGTILQDTSKQQWITGPSIGIGGFGEIYTACKTDARLKNPKDYPYVVKIVSTA